MTAKQPDDASNETGVSGERFRLALTGAQTFFGERLVAAMEEDPRCEHILVMDIGRPRTARRKTRFVRLDLTNPTADGQMAGLLEADGIDVFCHLAFLQFPSHASSWAHELESIGTLHAMNAAAEARVRKVVMSSTTMVYGAYPDNPNYLTEEHPLRGLRASRWVQDRVGAERELANLARDCPDIQTTSLRFCTILGPTIRTFFTRIFGRQLVVRLTGYDPLMQFLHEDDAVEALVEAVVEDRPGPINVVGDGVLYYSQALKLGGKIPVSIPKLLARPTTDVFWQLQYVDIPGTFLNYFRYSWCGDGRRMRRLMRFRPRYTSREALEAFYDALRQERVSGLRPAWQQRPRGLA